MPSPQIGPPSPGSPQPTFWWWLLLISSGFFVIFGVLAALFGSLPPASIWGDWTAQHFFARDFTADERIVFDFMRGPLGGTMAGSYLMQAAIVAIPLRRGERWAWWAVAGAVLLWFIVDSSVSAMHGAWFNVVRINLVALTVTFAGLLGTRSMLRDRPAQS